MENSIERTIPHIIHYCWFGNSEKPADIDAYIRGWKGKLPDYTFMEWNESAFSIETAPIYVQEAYAAKKYAFVSDYVRIYELGLYGGIYLDTDIEIIRRFDETLEGNEMVLGFESDRSLSTAFIASCKDNMIIKGFCDTYSSRHFIQADGTYDMSVINEHFSSYLQQYGVQLDDEGQRIIPEYKIAIYPREFFSAFDIKNWHVKMTDKTYTIHHMNASWSTKKKKAYFMTIHVLQKILGYKCYDKIKGIYDRLRG